jgi:hypothetical protein
MWFVNRQSYWGVDPEDQYCVEIAAGGLDYANPDMLVAKYEGEGEEYADPREAVETALKIRDAWKKDKPGDTINVAHGDTNGMTLPFEGDTDEALKEWAEKKYESLPKCDECGEIIGKDSYKCWEFSDFEFCREYCAEKWYSRQCEEDELVEEDI